MKILGAGYGLLNSVAPNNGMYGMYAREGASGAGSLYQFNDGKKQEQSFGAFSKEKVVIAGDSVDKFTLTGGWSNKSYQVDDETGIGGTLYENAAGGQVLVSGGGEVVLDNGSLKGKPKIGDLTKDITAIEKNNPEGPEEGLVTAEEIQKAITGGKIDESRRSFWQNIVDNFKSFDNNKGAGGKAVADDKVINIDDITANDPEVVA